MLEFNMAADAAEVDPDEDYVEVPLGGKIYRAYRPTLAQGALLVAAQGGRNLGMLFKLIKGILGEEAAYLIEDAVWARKLDFGDLVGGGTALNPEHGLLDGIFEAFGERPTQPSTGSSASRPAGGRKSTVRSPGKGSTRSASPSTDS